VTDLDWDAITKKALAAVEPAKPITSEDYARALEMISRPREDPYPLGAGGHPPGLDDNHANIPADAKPDPMLVYYGIKVFEDESVPYGEMVPVTDEWLRRVREEKE
jgi:hypothetical protein